MTDEPELPLSGEHQTLDAGEPGRMSMSVVQIEITGARRCAHSAHLTDATDEEIADEWTRTLLAAAALRGPHLTAALREAMSRVGSS